jgi:hypothetical protein
VKTVVRHTSTLPRGEGAMTTRGLACLRLENHATILKSLPWTVYADDMAGLPLATSHLHCMRHTRNDTCVAETGLECRTRYWAAPDRNNICGTWLGPVLGVRLGTRVVMLVVT